MPFPSGDERQVYEAERPEHGHRQTEPLQIGPRLEKDDDAAGQQSRGQDFLWRAPAMVAVNELVREQIREDRDEEVGVIYALRPDVKTSKHKQRQRQPPIQSDS